MGLGLCDGGVDTDGVRVGVLGGVELGVGFGSFCTDLAALEVSSPASSAVTAQVAKASSTITIGAPITALRRQ